MRQIVLPGTDMTVSRFAFGTAGLFNVGAARRRQALLAAACDHGFTHFDTAPYYGFGAAERDLKPVLAAFPNVTVATKVGLYSPGGEDQSDLAIFARKAAGKLFPALSRPHVDWRVARAREALSGSLRRLGRDRVDLYLLHEADLALLDADEWLRWLESERSRVARFGIAVDALRLKSFRGASTRLAGFIQTIDSLDGREADALAEMGVPMQITYGYVSSARKSGALTPVQEILVGALRRNRAGCVVVSTRRVERLKQYAAIAEAAATPA